MHGVRALLSRLHKLSGRSGGEGVVGVVGGTTPDKANPRGRGNGLAGVDGQGYPEVFPTYNQRTVNIQSTSSQHTVNIQSTHSQHISFSKGLWKICIQILNIPRVPPCKNLIYKLKVLKKGTPPAQEIENLYTYLHNPLEKVHVLTVC